MRARSFGGSLVFGAVAAAGYAPFALLCGPHPGGAATLALYAVLAAAAYAFALAPDRRRGLAGAALTAALGAGLLALGSAPSQAFAAAGLALAISRSALLYRSRFARALFAEGALLVAAVGVTRLLVQDTLVAGILAVWGFFLVQSVFFVIGGMRERSPAPAGADAFEVARTRAVSILEERSG
jgi:hypothetical protein